MAFEIGVIVRGEVEDIVENDRYIIDAATLWLSHEALNAWHETYTLTSRDCYVDGVGGDMQWNDRNAECCRNLERFHVKVKETLRIDEEHAISITHVISEVFAIAHMLAGA